MLESGQCSDHVVTLTGSLAGYYTIYNGITTVVQSDQLGPLSIVAIMNGLPLTLKTSTLNNVGVQILGFHVVCATYAHPSYLTTEGHD